MANDDDIGDVHERRHRPARGFITTRWTLDAGRQLSMAAGRLSRALRSMAVITRTDGVALMMAGGTTGPRAVGGSTAEGLELEYAEQAEHIGPAHESMAADHPVMVEDLGRHDGPGYARLARRASPVRAVLSVPVRLDGGVIGALNFYRCRPGAWTRDQIEIGERLADTAAELLVSLAARPASDDQGWP